MPLSDDVLRVGGRRVGYRLSGADTRPTLLYLHGMPSSRTELGDYEPGLLEEQGICAVAVDRPGYGATDPLDDLDLLARTKDAVAVAEHLGMAQFAVQGTSGGGHYALAGAVLMPDRVQAVILTSAGGCISEEGGLNGLPEDIADGWRRTWRDPEGTRVQREAATTRLRADPLESLRKMASKMPADEREWLERHSKALAVAMMEATRQGAVGWWLDGQATGQPWPFDVTDIQAPIHVFHGDSDSLASLPVLRRSLARAACVKESIYPGGNHFAPWATRERQAAMLAAVRDDPPGRRSRWAPASRSCSRRAATGLHLRTGAPISLQREHCPGQPLRAGIRRQDLGSVDL
jgi:pimeloyl-ACP methyl ester carboxylesterase